MTELFRRLRYLLNRRRFDRELAADMEVHREMAGTGGVRFGNPLRLREEAREAWGWTWVDRLSQDLRYAARMIRRSPGFTVSAVLMLGLGIGVNVAAFGFFNLMVLRPLPVRDPGTLLRFMRSAPGNFSDNLPYPAVAFYRQNSKTLSAVLALSVGRLAMEGDDRQVNAHFVTANFMTELGATARLGGLLDPVRDEAPGADPVVVLTYGFWQRHFGSDPSVVGKTIRLNDKPATVVGIASREFSGLDLGSPDLWAPITQRPYFLGGDINALADGGFSVEMWGRIQPGLTPKIVEDELRSLAAVLHAQHPKDIWDKETMPSEPGGYVTTGLMRGRLVPLLALVSTLVLLILAVACGNLGSLLLARGVAREREMAIRVAAGAGRGRLIRQLFTESLVLALLGSVAGLALGYVVLRGLMVWTGVPAWLDPTPDWRVIVVAIGLGFAASILFGLTPALQVARQRHRAGRVRQILIGAQVAASCVLLVVAGLLVRALDHAASTSPGFEYQQVISIDPGISNYSPGAARVYLDALENRLRNLPGVVAVSLASNPPLGNRWSVMKAEIGGRAVDVHTNHIDPPFFETMRIPLLRGRNLARGDTRAIIVSESLAQLQWPGEDPLGRSFKMGVDSAGAEIRPTVVGVSGSARLLSPEDPDAVEIYQLADQSLLPSMVMLVRTSAPPEGIVPMVGSIAKTVDAKVFPVVELMKVSFQRRLATAEYGAVAVSLLGVLALGLACLGIVGLVAYAVSQRTKEIGIRMALGAKSGDVLTVVLRQFSLPVVVGLVVGVAGAAALSQILRRQLYGISSLDPITYVAAIGLFVVTVAVAAVLPARRALRVDPVRALRWD
ncbi:MAG: ADOP family duplicated permease [Gemmatimonadota bacterium]